MSHDEKHAHDFLSERSFLIITNASRPVFHTSEPEFPKEQKQHFFPPIITHSRPPKVRVFGESDPLVGVCNRDTENLFYADAFQQGFGPGVVATFGNGRIERFFEDHRPLEPTEMLEPKFRDQISRICARLHELEMSSEVERAMAKWLMAGGEPEEDRGVAGRTGRTALIWSQNEDWLRKARKLYEAHRHQGGGEKWAFLDEALPKMERELAFWKGELGAGASSDGGALPADSGTSGVVEKQREICRQFWADVRPCHNDLLCGNMLQPLTTRGDGPPAGDHGGPAPVGTTSLAKEGLKVIDFEYALPNHVGFDVCNHFAAVPESMLIADGNFSPRKWFPDRNWIREWVRFYADERLSLRRDRRENAANTAVGTKKSYDAYSYQELVMWSG